MKTFRRRSRMSAKAKGPAEVAGRRRRRRRSRPSGPRASRTTCRACCRRERRSRCRASSSRSRRRSTPRRATWRRWRCGSSARDAARPAGSPGWWWRARRAKGRCSTRTRQVHLVEWLREVVPEDRWLIAGTGAESTRATVRLSERAAAAGADAVLVRPPAYFGPVLTPAGPRRPLPARRRPEPGAGDPVQHAEVHARDAARQPAAGGGGPPAGHRLQGLERRPQGAGELPRGGAAAQGAGRLGLPVLPGPRAGRGRRRAGRGLLRGRSVSGAVPGLPRRRPPRRGGGAGAADAAGARDRGRAGRAGDQGRDGPGRAARRARARAAGAARRAAEGPRGRAGRRRGPQSRPPSVHVRLPDALRRRGRRPVGRRGQGQGGGCPRRARRPGGALPGRRQRRPHRGRAGRRVRPPPDPVGHPAPGHALRHRERRGPRPRDAVPRDRRADRARRRDRGAAGGERPRPPRPPLPQAAGRRERAEQGDRHHQPRHRAGVRGQDRPPRRARGRSPAPGDRRQARARRAASAPTRCSRWPAPRSAAPSRRSSACCASIAPRMLPFIGDAGKLVSTDARRRRERAARGRAGRAARRGPRHLSVRDLVAAPRRAARPPARGSGPPRSTPSWAW